MHTTLHVLSRATLVLAFLTVTSLSTFATSLSTRAQEIVMDLNPNIANSNDWNITFDNGVEFRATLTQNNVFYELDLTLSAIEFGTLEVSNYTLGRKFIWGYFGFPADDPADGWNLKGSSPIYNSIGNDPLHDYCP